VTCIVGVQHEGRVYIGGDSAGVAGRTLTPRSDPKVFTNGQYLMGFALSFRMGQLLRYAFKAPEPKGNLDRFMATTFADAVRDCFERGGFLQSDRGREEGGLFLIGVHGQLYSFEADHQFCRTHDDYLAIGCGDDVALGSLHSTRGQAPRTRIKKALEAAAYHNTGVCGPFVIKAEPS
jgi:ATP-dependent protease HslVU (ClpYQ) peptidase subunit